MLARSLLFVVGLVTGSAAGLLGIGGGLLMVPVLTLWGASTLQATATSLVGVCLGAISGSARNWQTGDLSLRGALALALGGILGAQAGAWLGDRVPDFTLDLGFAALQVAAIFLLGLRRRLQQRDGSETIAFPWGRTLAIGVLAGILSGLFGVGGGVVMVPLQMLILSVPIKVAVRTSLGAIVPIAASGLVTHSYNGNVLWVPGLFLGAGGVLGAQLGTRVLPKLSDRRVGHLFRALLLVTAAYMAIRGLVEVFK